MITIYGSDGTVRLQAPCDDSSTQSKELQGDNVLALSFTLYAHVPLEVGDYADFQGERYWLMEAYRPEQASTMEWKYNVRMYGLENLAGRFLVLNDTDGADEAVFTLTAPASEHLKIIIASMNAGMDGAVELKPGEVVETDYIVIDYDGTYCGDALKTLAEKAGTKVEWWFDGVYANLCRCERGEEVPLGYGKGLTSLGCDKADNAKFYTRLYPKGSTKNIDPEKYGHTRLQLPGGVKHVDVNVEKYGVWHRFEEAAFKDIFPRYTGTVSSVRSEERKNDDGTPYAVWLFKDDTLPFDPNEYEIGGKVKRVSFQEGSDLAGLGTEEDGTYYFEANYDSSAGEWELITVWPYGDGTQLPNESLAPKPGDRYIPWNFRMPDEYYPLAEQEFMEAVEKYNDENAVDVGRYKGPTDHVYIEENAVDLYVGRRVRLESAQYFPETGFRSSRITKVTRNVNMPSQMNVEISDAVSRGTFEAIGDDINDARNTIREATDDFPDIIKTGDSTPASDSNVFSALKSLATFLRKDRADTAHGLITLERGAEFGVYAPGWQGTGAKVDAGGAAEVDSLMVRKRSLFGGLLGSAEFTSGFPNGKGWQLYPYTKTNAAGQEETKWGLEIDGVTVRGTFRVYEMIVNQLRGENDNYIFAGMMKVDHYDPASGRIYLDTEKGVLYNPFREGDMLMVQRFGGADNMSVKQYELRVTAAGTGDLSDGEDRLDWLEFTNLTASVDDIAGRDILVRVDSLTDPTRKGIVTVTTINDTGAPYIDVLYGLKTDPDDATRCRMGNLSGIRTKSGVDLTGVWGLYARGAYIEQSTMVLDNGNTVEQQFQVMDGKLLSEIAEVRAAVQQEGEVLANPSFARDTIHWTADTGTTFYEHRDSLMWDGSEFMAERRGGTVSIAEDGGRNSLLIVASSIGQDVAEMSLPTHAAADPGDPEAGEPADPGDEPPYTYSFSLYIRVVEAGTLTAGIEGSGLWLAKEMQPTEGYEKVAAVGTWDETGAFTIAFTGRAYVRDASLRNDALAGATERLKTIIKQTAEEIKLWAGKEIETATGEIADKLESELSVMADKISMCVTHDEFDEKTGELETRWEGKLTVLSNEINLRVTKEQLDAATGEVTEKLQSQIDVQAGQITGVSQSITNVTDELGNVKQQISTAGWITKPEAQTLFASKTLENGSTIVSYINQTASSIKISAEHLELDGVVSFSMFDYDTQRIINDIGDAADNAQSTASSAMSDAQDAYSRAQSAINEARAAADDAADASTAASNAQSTADDAKDTADSASSAASNAQSTANNAQSTANSANTTAKDAQQKAEEARQKALEAIDQAADAITKATEAADGLNGLGALAYKDMVSEALLDETIVMGGYLNTNFIKVKRIDAEEGYIAGFNIVGNTLTNQNFDTSAAIIIRDDPHGIFAAVGGNVLPATAATRAVARFENRDSSDIWHMGANYALIVGAEGTADCRALFMDGGSISGFAMRNTIVTSSQTLNRADYNVICANNSEITLTLPSMRHCDDGHVIRFRQNNASNVHIKASACYTGNYASQRYGSPVIVYGDGEIVKPMDTINLVGRGRGFELVWVRDIQHTVSGVTYYGAWIEYKLPASW